MCFRYMAYFHTVCVHTKCESIMMAPQTRCMQRLRLSFKNKIILAHMKKNTQFAQNRKPQKTLWNFECFIWSFVRTYIETKFTELGIFQKKKRLKKCNSNRKKKFEYDINIFPTFSLKPRDMMIFVH